ncbi:MULTISPECIES: glycosyltransferase family 2 protein [Clostridium]|uniref:glycosyltransferase family 2 protein n=1 Tax=Clostridium TaxID=1485 RepID=UPI0005C1C955|nr:MULTISPECIES: glycosyltransferase family 2 protein [Clostridium]KIU08521.1 glycosyl transferase, family 2 [Clostridium butyricum]MBA8968354.1 glycosyltransferase involved in cell wall biosynthesis [Clostridium butyricum]MBA8970591.1 glycosyltransferase involved in cell wall biosynthesis [Clostridium butyricum]MBC2426690.1 glycosyltransferase family 2 protein [Clostridium butyricum]MDU0322215.1 glycosyltransferase family 2 protein [Clostridium butyricum]
MLSLTTIILTKNEENNIEKCIRSLDGLAERIIVVDSFSDDNTKDLALSLNADVYENKFISHSNQFNWALKNCNITSEWIFRIDADEEMTAELVEEFKDKIPKITEGINGVFLRRRRYFMGRWIKHGDVYPEKVMRLFRTGTAESEDRTMDEHIVLKFGDAIEFESDFEDKDTKDLTFWINKHNWYSNKESAEFIKIYTEQSSNNELHGKILGNQCERRRWLKNKIYYKIPLFVRPVFYFIYRYFFKLGFLDGKEGLIYHVLQAFWYRFLVDSKIYESYKLN